MKKNMKYFCGVIKSLNEKYNRNSHTKTEPQNHIIYEALTELTALSQCQLGVILMFSLSIVTHTHTHRERECERETGKVLKWKN